MIDPVGATVAPITKREKPQLSARLAADFIKKHCRNSDLANVSGAETALPHPAGASEKGALVANFVELFASPSAAKTRSASCPNKVVAP